MKYRYEVKTFEGTLSDVAKMLSRDHADWDVVAVVPESAPLMVGATAYCRYGVMRRIPL